MLLYRLEDRRLQAFFAARREPSRAAVLAVCAELAKHRGELRSPKPAELAAVTGVGERKVDAILAHLDRLRDDASAAHSAATLAERLWCDTEARKLTARRRLEAMMHYGQSTMCRVVEMARYFGDGSERCTRCDTCLS